VYASSFHPPPPPPPPPPAHPPTTTALPAAPPPPPEPPSLCLQEHMHIVVYGTSLSPATTLFPDTDAPPSGLHAVTAAVPHLLRCSPSQHSQCRVPPAPPLHLASYNPSDPPRLRKTVPKVRISKKNVRPPHRTFRSPVRGSNVPVPIRWNRAPPSERQNCSSFSGITLGNVSAILSVPSPPLSEVNFFGTWISRTLLDVVPGDPPFRTFSLQVRG